jgi:O-antigen/teichoic acid export membrane protein
MLRTRIVSLKPRTPGRRQQMPRATMSIGVVQSVASRVLYGLGRLRWFARLALIESAVNVLLTLLLIQRFELIGVALAVAIPNVLFCVATIVIACRSAGIDGRSYVRAILTPIVISLVPVAIWVAMGPTEPHYATIISRGLVGVVVYGVGLIGLMRFPVRVRTRGTSMIPVFGR